VRNRGRNSGSVAFRFRRFEQLRVLDLAARSQKTVVTDFGFEKDKVFSPA